MDGSTARAGLRREVALSFAVLTLLLSGHAMLETARDALFLADLPASQLPWVYLGIAGAAFIVVRKTRRTGKLGSALLSWIMLGAALVTAGLWLLSARAGTTFLYVLYIWTGVVATVAVGQFWLTAGERFDVAQAKRAFAVIGAGGLVGATLGSGLSALLLLVISPSELLLSAALMFAATGVCARALPRVEASAVERTATEPDPGLRAHPYLVRLLLVALLTAVAVTLLDLVFKTVVDQRIPPEKLGLFFAGFYTGLNGLSLLIQLLVASWLLRTLGVNRALWVLPTLALAGAVGFVVTAAVLPILLMKVVDGSLRHSLHRTSSELLYMPVPLALRTRYKVAIDAIGSRGGQALACVVVLSLDALGASPAHLAVALVVIISVWVSLLYGVKGQYVDLFRRELRRGTIETRVSVPDLDLHSLEALMSALGASDDATVLNAMDILERAGRGRLVPALILYHPSREVVLRALELFASEGRTDFLPLIDVCMRSIDPEIRAAALRVSTSVDPDLERLERGLADSSALVRASATIGLLASGLARRSEVEEAIARIVEDGDRTARVALVRAIGQGRVTSMVPVLVRLATLGDVEVGVEVARVTPQVPSAELIEPLIAMLGDRRARSEARAALVALGEPALDALEAKLAQPELSARLRLHVPRTISRFASPRAASILLESLPPDTEGGIAYKALRGLGRLHGDHPRAALDAGRLAEIQRGTMERAITLLSARLRLSDEDMARTTGGELLLALLGEKERAAVERVFRILALSATGDEFRVLYEGLAKGDAKARANSREVFENLYLEPNLRSAILALTSNQADGARLAQCAAYFSPPAKDARATLRALIHDRSDAVSALAVHTVGEAGVRELEPELTRLDASSRPMMSDVIHHALRLLAGDLDHGHAH